MSSAFGAYAQDVEGRVTLDEVTVKAAKVVNKAEKVCQNSLILKKSQSPDFHKPGLCYV